MWSNEIGEGVLRNCAEQNYTKYSQMYEMDVYCNNHHF